MNYSFPTLLGEAPSHKSCNIECGSLAWTGVGSPLHLHNSPGMEGIGEQSGRAGRHVASLAPREPVFSRWASEGNVLDWSTPSFLNEMVR
jgi:hypothetical protein